MTHENNDSPIGQHNKPISIRGQLQHILKHLSPEDLSDFVLETAAYDRNFRETFLIAFSDLLSDEQTGVPRYQARLYKILARYTNADGYISQRNATALNTSVAALLDTARKATTPPRESVDLSIAVLSIMPRLGDKMDDSEEYLYALMAQACAVLSECFEGLKSAAQQECFEQILGFYTEPEYLDLDLDSFLLVLLKEWSRDSQSRQIACMRVQETMLKDCGDDQWRKSYLLERTNELLAYWKPDK